MAGKIDNLAIGLALYLIDAKHTNADLGKSSCYIRKFFRTGRSLESVSRNSVGLT